MTDSPLGPLPKVTTNDELEELSYKKLASALPTGRLYLRGEFGLDKGVDRQIELFRNGYATNCRAHVQVKATSSNEFNADGSFSFSVETPNLNHLLNGACPIYVLYLQCLDQLRIAYAAEEARRLDSENPNWLSQDHVTIRFSRILTDEEFDLLEKSILQDSQNARKARIGGQAIVEPAPTQGTSIDVDPAFRILARTVGLLCDEGAYDEAVRIISVETKDIVGEKAEIERLNLNAFVLRRKGKFEAAAQAYVELYQRKSDARFLLARITTLCAQGKWEVAKAEFLALPPAAQEARMYSMVDVQIRYHEGDYLGALHSLHRMPERRSRREDYRTDYWRILAAIYSKLNQVKRALRAAEKAIKASPTAASVPRAQLSHYLCRMGEIYGDVSFYERAIQPIEQAQVEFKAFVLPTPEDQEEFLRYMVTVHSTALFGAGRISEAYAVLKAFEESHEVDDLFRYNTALVGVSVTGDGVPDDVIRGALTIVDDPSIWFNLINKQLVRFMNDKEEPTAIQLDIEKFAERYPENPTNYYFQACLALGRRNIEEALQLFSSAIESPMANTALRINAINWSYIGCINFGWNEKADEIFLEAQERDLQSAELISYVIQYYSATAPFAPLEKWERALGIISLLPKIMLREQTRGAGFKSDLFRQLGERVFNLAIQVDRIETATRSLDEIMARLPNRYRREFEEGMQAALVTSFARE